MPFTISVGTNAPHFSLPGVDGATHELQDFQDAAVLVVVFTCNHCHYAYGMDDRLNEYAAAMQHRGVAVVAINSNDTANHPDDSFDDMIVQHAAYFFKAFCCHNALGHLFGNLHHVATGPRSSDEDSLPVLGHV